MHLYLLFSSNQEQQKMILQVNSEISTVPFWENDWTIEIAGSLILTILGFLVIQFLRPRVKISDNICKTIDSKTGKVSYKIKVINRSFFFRLIDIHFELTLLKPKSSPKGMNLAIKQIDLISNHVWYLSRRKLVSQKSDYATYAIVITVDKLMHMEDEKDLLEFWKSEDNMFLDFKVIAKNNFSGITSISHKKFDHYSSIKEGLFQHGNSLEIEKIDC